MMEQYISWDRAKLERFKTEYDKHKDDRNAIFRFEGYPFHVGFAHYLIQYLEMELPK